VNQLSLIQVIQALIEVSHHDFVQSSKSDSLNHFSGICSCFAVLAHTSFFFSSNTSISSRLAIQSRVSNHAKANALHTATVSSFSNDFSFPVSQNECHVKTCSVSLILTRAVNITVLSLISNSVSIDRFLSYFS